MSKGVHVSSGCARYRSVYVRITVKGSRVCEHCKVLAVRKYVRASMVEGYILVVVCTFTRWIELYRLYLSLRDKISI